MEDVAATSPCLMPSRDVGKTDSRWSIRHGGCLAPDPARRNLLGRPDAVIGNAPLALGGLSSLARPGRGEDPNVGRSTGDEQSRGGIVSSQNRLDTLEAHTCTQTHTLTHPHTHSPTHSHCPRTRSPTHPRAPRPAIHLWGKKGGERSVICLFLCYFFFAVLSGGMARLVKGWAPA